MNLNDFSNKIAGMLAESGQEFLSHVLYEDGDVLVFDKPSGMQTQGASDYFPDGGAQDIVRVFRGNEWSSMHRIDRDTSGIVLFGRGPKIRAELQRQFAQREVGKHYLAIVAGEFDSKILGIVAPLKHYPEEARVKVETSDKAKQAATSFRLIDTITNEYGVSVSMLWIRIYTGRTHQIRAHLSHLGYPIVGDSWYNPNPCGARRLLLHASQLCFSHPTSHNYIQVDAPTPGEFLINHNPLVA